MAVVVTVAGMTAGAKQAAAYSDAEISSYLRHRFSCSVLKADGVQAARVRGTGGPAQVFTYGAEGCPALGFSGTSFAVVVPGPGGMRLLAPQPTPAGIQGVTVSDRYIVATSYDYAPNDPRCCPSRLVRSRWTVSGDRLVRAP